MLEEIKAYFEMGGYGGYIWAAYGFAALVLIALIVTSLASARRRRRELEQLEALVPRRRRAARPSHAGSQGKG